MAFSPDGRLIAAGGGNDWSVILWDATTGKEVRILNAHEVVSGVAFSADSKLVATDGVLFDSNTGEHVNDLGSGGYDVAFSPDGNFVATASGYDPSLGVRLFDPSTGVLIRTITREYADSLAFSSDGKMLATTTGYLNRGVRLWDPRTGKLIRTMAGGSGPIAFSPDGRFLAMARNGTIGLYNPATGGHIRDLDAGVSISFSHDGTLLIVGDNKSVRLYNSLTGNPLRTLDGVFANMAIFNPTNGKYIAVASPDRTVRIVDATK